MPKLALISNTSPLLYLGRIEHAHLLPALFDPVYVPEPVLLELDAGRLLRSDTIDPRAFQWATRVSVPQSDIDNLPPNHLGSGERAVLAYGSTHAGCVVGLDDRQARLLAEQLGRTTIGTVGILVKARKANLITSVRPLLDALQKQGFHLSVELHAEALRLASEE